MFIIYLSVGVSSGEYPIIVGEAPPHGHAKTNGLRVFVDRMDWEGKPQLAKNAPKEQFSPRKSQKSDGEVGVAANVPTKTVVQTKESDVFGIPAGDQKG
jgi:hypothetical protein